MPDFILRRSIRMNKKFYFNKIFGISMFAMLLAILIGSTLFIDSIFRVLTPTEILSNYAGLILIISVFSLIISFLTFLFMIILWPWRDYIYRAVLVLAFLLFVFIVYQNGQALVFPSLDSALSISVRLTATCFNIVVLVISLICSIFIWKQGFLFRKLDELASDFYKPSIYIISISIAITSSWIAWHLPPGHAGAHTAPPDLNYTSISPGNHRPNIVLITFDALSAADMSLYGYKLTTTPNMDKFASESFVFDNMYSNSHWTKPSVTSLLTGMYPSKHKLYNIFYGNRFLKEPEKTLPMVLKENGYYTCALTNNFIYAHPFCNGTGYSFDSSSYETDLWQLPDTDKFFFILRYGRWLSLIRLQCEVWLCLMARPYWHLVPATKWGRRSAYDSERLFKKAKFIMEEQKRPIFLWMHIIDPHGPYLPPEPFRYKFLQEDIYSSHESLYEFTLDIAPSGNYSPSHQGSVDKLRLRYDENILYADHIFEEIIDYLKSRGDWDETVVVISSDHGESFEKGFWGHFWKHSGPVMHQSLIHIPLLIRLPGIAKGERIETNSELIDIAPTILEYCGIEKPEWMQGESLLSKVQNGPDSPNSGRVIFSMQLDGNKFSGPFRRGTVAAIEGQDKLIMDIGSRGIKLYDLADDPGENHDLSGIQTAKAEKLKDAIEKQLLSDTEQTIRPSK